MKREIKFRAWTDLGIIINDYCFLNVENNHFEAEDLTNNNFGNITSVMQFTGLKDKNGKEIYEGDVVKADWHWEDGKIVDLSYEGCFFYAIQEYVLEDVLEVIGNIYENPELIKH